MPEARLDCESAVHAIADGLAALRLMCEAINTSPSQLDQGALGRAMNVTLRPIEIAAKDLDEKLGLGSGDGGADGEA